MHDNPRQLLTLSPKSCLQGVQRALLPAASAATSGHVTLLKQKALTGILRRLDALLFGKLLGGEFL